MSTIFSYIILIFINMPTLVLVSSHSALLNSPVAENKLCFALHESQYKVHGVFSRGKRRSFRRERQLMGTEPKEKRERQEPKTGTSPCLLSSLPLSLLLPASPLLVSSSKSHNYITVSINKQQITS